MTEHDRAFLQAIREHPEDDTSRLVYADWLDERGQLGDAARGEFIRIQCASAQMSEDDPQSQILRDRAQQLLARHRAEWLRPLRDIAPGLGDGDVHFARGFPDRIVLRTTESLSQAARLAALVPLRELGLDLGPKCIGAEAVPAVAHSPGFSLLTHLDLGGNDIGPEGAHALADAQDLHRLTHLRLHLSAIGAAGASALAKSPGLSNLTEFVLGFSDVGDEGARELAASPNLHSLTRLDLSCNHITDEGARALLQAIRSGSMPHLTSLELDGNRIGPNVLQEIGAPWLPGRGTPGIGNPRLVDSVVRGKCQRCVIALGLFCNGRTVAGAPPTDYLRDRFSHEPLIRCFAERTISTCCNV